MSQIIENEPKLDLGTEIGRAQAFGVVANKCSAAQAEALRHIRDSEAYKELGVTWTEFCPRFTGYTRPRVDAIIENLEEFGETYFRLAEIVRISPETFRQIAPKVDGETIEIAGEMVPIIAENAARIRGAVKEMRAQIQKLSESPAAPAATVAERLQARLDACLSGLARLAGRAESAEDRAALVAIAAAAMDRLSRLTAELG